MKINTKVVFEWNSKSKQYEEIYCDSYEYDGEVAECQYWDELPLTGGGGMMGMFGRGSMFDPGGGFMGTGGAGGYGGGFSYVGGGAQTVQQQTARQFTPVPTDPPRRIGLAAPAGEEYTSTFGKQFSGAGGGIGTEEFAAGLPGPSGVWSGGGGTPNATMYNPQRQFDQYSGMGNQDYMNKLRSFGSEGSMFGPTLQQPTRPDVGTSYGTAEPSMLGDVQIADIPIGGETSLGEKGPGLFEKMKTAWGGMSTETKAGGIGALAGGFLGYRQAKSQQKGLGAAIKEIDPLKGKFMGEHKRHLGLAEAYRPGGRYSQYMAGQIMGQAAESAGQESQRMIASGITSPSMMRAMARQSRATAQHALPGMELQMSQMALPYEQLGAKSLTQYGGVVEQLASLKGARAAIDPTSAAIKGGMEGIMAAGQMMSSFIV